MIPTDMKTEEQPKPALAPEPAWHKAKYIAVNASENALIDEIIDLKRKLNTMVRIANVLFPVAPNRRWKDTFPEADQLVWNQLVAQGFGGDEVPE